MTVVKPASSKRRAITGHDSPAAANKEPVKLSPVEIAQLSQEQLSPVERTLLDQQIQRHQAEGKVPRQINIAVLTRAVLWRHKKEGSQTAPAFVPAEAWQKFLRDSDVCGPIAPRFHPHSLSTQVSAVRNAMSPNEAAHWAWRHRVLWAHHAVAFPDYKYAPKHLPREEKARRIQESNKARAAKGLAPLPQTKRGRPTKARSTTPVQLFNHEYVGVSELPPLSQYVYPAPPRDDRDVSPTSTTSGSFPMSMSSANTSSVALSVGMHHEFTAQFTLPPTDAARDDTSVVWECTQAARRSSYATLQHQRGSATDYLRTIALPSVDGFSQQQPIQPFDSGLGLSNLASGSGHHAYRPNSLDGEVLPNISLSQRRNSEFRFFPPAMSMQPPQHSFFHHQPAFVHQQQPQQFVPAQLPMAIQIPVSAAPEQSLWTTTNPFASVPQQQSAYDGFNTPVSATQMPTSPIEVAPFQQASMYAQDETPAFSNPFAESNTYPWSAQQQPSAGHALNVGLRRLSLEDSQSMPMQQSQDFFVERPQSGYPVAEEGGLLFSSAASPTSSASENQEPIDLGLY